MSKKMEEKRIAKKELIMNLRKTENEWRKSQSSEIEQQYL